MTYAPPGNYQPPFYDPAAGLTHATYSDPGFGAPLNTLEPYSAPGPQLALNPAPTYQALGVGNPSLAAGYETQGPFAMGGGLGGNAYGPAIQMGNGYTLAAPTLESQLSSIGSGSSLINSAAPVTNAIESATPEASGLSQYLGSAGLGGLLGALRPSNIRAGMGETGGPGGLATGGISLGGNLLGQALVGRGGAVGQAGHGIKGAATGFGLGSLAAAGLVGANVAAPEVALPIEGIAALAGGALGLFGHKSQAAATNPSALSTDPNHNDTLIRNTLANQVAIGQLSPSDGQQLQNQYALGLQFAGSDQAKLQVQQALVTQIQQAATQSPYRQTQADKLQQQAQLTEMLKPYLRSNIDAGNTLAATEHASRAQLPPEARAFGDLLAHQAQSQAHQTSANLAGAAAVGPGLNQLIQAIQQQNAIQTRTNALSSSGATGSGSIIPSP